MLIYVEFSESSYCSVDVDVADGCGGRAAGFVEHAQVGADLVDAPPPFTREYVYGLLFPAPFAGQHSRRDVLQELIHFRMQVVLWEIVKLA